MATGIEQLYRDVLGRAPDAGGLDYWSRMFGPTIEPEEVATFKAAAAPELQTQSQIKDLYQKVLGRAPEAEGMDYWLNQFGPGALSQTELDTFNKAAQAELNPTGTNPPQPQYGGIEDLYQKLLFRAPDAEGRQYWQQRFGSEISPEEVEEFKRGIQPELQAREKIEGLYKNYLNRPSDPEGMLNWLTQFGTDVSPEEIEQFKQSANVELKNLGRPLIPVTTSGAPTGVTTAPIDPSQSTLSPNFADYVYRMLAKGEQAASMPYQAYTGQRFAETSPALQQGIGAYLNLAPPSQFGEATGIARTVAEQAARGGEYRPGYFSTDSFTSPYAVQSYMSPYMQAVVDRQQREAIRADEIARQGRQALFAQRGAYGGSRQAIEEAEAQRNLQTRMGDIQALGLQSAYQQAQQQFNTEQQARMEAQKATEASRQFGAGYGLKALEPQLQAAQQMGTIGAQSGDYLMKGLSGLMEAGKTQQQLAQQPYDFGYQQWQESQKYPYQQATYMGSLLGGLPLRANTYDSGTSGLAGLLSGLATGAGIYGALNK